MSYIPKSLRNPVPEQIHNVNQLTDRIFKEYGIIPYFGTAEHPSHYWLTVLKNITALSPTHNICKQNISDYAFGGIVDDQKFIDTLGKVGLKERKILGLSKQLHAENVDTGNQYLRIRAAQVNNEWRVSMSSVDSRQTAYLRTKELEQPQLIYTAEFSESYWKKVKPELVAASQFDGDLNVTTVSNGVFETILHLKTAEGTFYGRPKIINILDDLAVDYLVRNLNAKISGTEMISKYLLLIAEQKQELLNEGDDPRVVATEIITTLRKLATTEGDTPHTLGYIQYPEGTAKPEMLKFDLNRSPAFNESSLKIAENSIYSINNWSKMLASAEGIPGSLGSNVLPAVYIQKSVTNIRPTQGEMVAFFERAFEWIAMVTGVREFEGLTYEYNDTVREVVDELKALNTPQNTTTDDNAA